MIVEKEYALRIREWIDTRGGVAIWKALDPANPREIFTPALTGGKPTERPHWSVGSVPEKTITSYEEVQVQASREVRRFRVAIRMGSNGMKLKLTDASSEKVRKAVSKAGEGAYHSFDYETQEAIIYKRKKIVPLTDWRS